MRTVKLSSIPCLSFGKEKGEMGRQRIMEIGNKLWMERLNGSENSNIKKNSDWQGTEYEVYCLSKKEWLLYGGQGILYLALLTYVFYRNILMFLVFAPFGACYPLFLRKTLKKKRLETLRLQFKDAILSVASGLNAGYSVENAFAGALRETERIHGKDSMMAEELRLLLRKTRLNQTFEMALENFADRSGLEDVRNFSDVFLAARKSGGELMKIIARTAEIIGEKIRIQEDILTMTASKRMEQRIMSGIPLFIVFYIEVTSPGFFDILYKTLPGRIIMTVCAGIYLISCQTTRMILEIEV